MSIRNDSKLSSLALKLLLRQIHIKTAYRRVKRNGEEDPVPCVRSFLQPVLKSEGAVKMPQSLQPQQPLSLRSVVLPAKELTRNAAKVIHAPYQLFK